MIVRINHTGTNYLWESAWEWSGPIDISHSRTVNFVIRPNEKYKEKPNMRGSAVRKESVITAISMQTIDEPVTEVKYLKAEITKSNAILYISFYQMEGEKIAYKLRNECPSFHIFYRQCAVDEREKATNYREERHSIKDSPIKPKEQELSEGVTPFSWQFPNKPPILELKFSPKFKEREVGTKFVKQEKELQINIDKINEDKSLFFTFTNTLLIVRAKTYIKGCSRILWVTEESKPVGL